MANGEDWFPYEAMRDAFSRVLLDRPREIVGTDPSRVDPLSRKQGIYQMQSYNRVMTPWSRFHLNDGDLV